MDRGPWQATVHGVAKESDTANMYTTPDQLCSTVETTATLQSNYTPIKFNLKNREPQDFVFEYHEARVNLFLLVLQVSVLIFH